MAQDATMSRRLPFPGRLQQARKDAGFTIARLAYLMNVDPRTVAGWQAGRSTPSLERVNDLARILNVAPSFFLDEEAA